jgi:Pyridine nucleotide-disulphide oxidoreductase
MTETTDVAIVGAGPYGLSLAAHLRARGTDFRIFGPAMKFWRDMPVGVNLKSLAFATSVYVPEPGYRYEEWCRKHGLEDFEPCTMQTFAEYGLWMQQRFVPELEEVLVANIAAAGDRFEVTLDSGRSISARRVVVCTGLSYLADCPEVLVALPPTVARHTSSISDYSQLRGKTVAVIGGGASAIEAGALVREAGGTSEIFVRQPEAIFHGRSARVRPLKERIKAPMSVLGASRHGWLLQHFPPLVHFLPEARRLRVAQRWYGPASPWWIKDRVLGKVPIHVQTEVIAARAVGDCVRLKVRDKDQFVREVEVDRVIAGTGFKSDPSLLPFLGQDLQQRIRRTGGGPSLNLSFESSVKGLHFVGPLSAMSFGPLFRFVAGAPFTVHMLARRLAGPFPLVRASGIKAIRGAARYRASFREG